MRIALPNAAFIDFTGTPLFKQDQVTKRIFGDYVSGYDFKRSEEDGATVKLVYANRGEKLILSAAAQRDDRCLITPKSLKGASAQKVASKLPAAGLVKEIKAKSGMGGWRRDDNAGQSFALTLTAAGTKAIAVDDEDGTPPTATAHSEPPMIDEGNDAQTARSPEISMAAPREETKMGRVIGLLQREDGATPPELIAATDWLPHTTRAMMTALRRRGYPVTLDRSDKERGSAYFIPRDHSVAEVQVGAAAIERRPAPAPRSNHAARSPKPEPTSVSPADASAYCRLVDT